MTTALIREVLEECQALAPDLAAAIVTWLERHGHLDHEGAARPFVELLLLEVRHAASAPGWTAAMRRSRIESALDFGGFR